MQAIAILRAEHRALAAVIHGLVFLVREARTRDATPDFDLLGAMLRYIEAFPERLHHPKEDAWLFARLRARHPAAAPLLDRLQQEHADGALRMQALAASLAQWRDCASDGGQVARQREAFATLVDRYAAFHWEHMRQEELEVLPLCVAHLDRDDWNAIDAAFAANADPLSDSTPATEFDALFRRIVAAAPPPVGTADTTR